MGGHHRPISTDKSEPMPTQALRDFSQNLIFHYIYIEKKNINCVVDMKQMPMDFYREMDDEIDMEFEIIRQNHLEAEMLSKKGVRVKKPYWSGPMAS